MNIICAAAWPSPLSESAYHGIAGDFLRLVEPHTEADPAALLFQFLTFAGNCFGNGAWYAVEATKHYPNLFSVIVGKTAKSRKGTSEKRVRSLSRAADPSWEQNQTANGLSTGEGLIERVRDPIYAKNKKGEDELVDPGIIDKRLLVVEEELQRVLRVMNRDSNTLSAVLRTAWDGNTLALITRANPIKATGAVISIVAHTTLSELKDDLRETQAANGFGNRFLFCLARRSKLLPDGGAVDDRAFGELAERLHAVIRECPKGQLSFDTIARTQWHQIYEEIAEKDCPGICGSLTARNEAQICRVALIYALLDGQSQIGDSHLVAANEVVRYANDSVCHIW